MKLNTCSLLNCGAELKFHYIPAWPTDELTGHFLRIICLSNRDSARLKPNCHHLMHYTRLQLQGNLHL